MKRRTDQSRPRNVGESQYVMVRRLTRDYGAHAGIRGVRRIGLYARIERRQLERREDIESIIQDTDR